MDRSKGGGKRSLFTDPHGIPLAVVIDGTSRHDTTLAKSTLSELML
jgi:hypothetical protein